MKKLFAMALIVFFALLSSCVGAPDNVTQSKPKYSSLSEVALDELQQLYVDFDASMSYPEALVYVEATGLPYSAIKYNGSRTIQVAFNGGVTAQKYTKDSGDYVEIIYVYPNGENSSNDNLEKYSFGTCSYSSNSLSLIEHINGSYFSYRAAGNYISNLGSDLQLDTSMTKEEQMLYFFNAQ